MRTRFFFTVVALTSLTITAPAIATANEYSCANAAAENGYVSAGKYLQQIQQDCAVAYSITSAGGGGAAAVAAAEQYLRSLGYDAATVEQMDIAGHGT